MRDVTPWADRQVSDFFSRYVEALERTERLPLPQLARYQETLLARLVRHAHANTTFYRDRLEPLLTPDGGTDLSRWNEVPILTREDAIAHGGDMRVAGLPEILGEITEIQTSGTTGMPLKIAVNALVPFSLNAIVTRLARAFNLDTSLPLASIRRFPRSTDAPYPDGIKDRGWSYADLKAPSFALNLETPLDRQLEWLARRRAPYLITYPSNAMALAHSTTPQEGRLLGIEVVISGAETVPEGARELIAERFGARLVAVYGCEEIGAVATECAAAPHYHVAAENALVEIVDEEGRDVRHGERGRILLTGFFNYAMPFIRYAIGDVAVAGAGQCPCGRTLPVIAQVEGRTRNAFVFRDGTRTWPRGRVVREMRAFVPFTQYQLVQLDFERVELRYVPDGSGRAPDLDGLTSFAREKLHPSVVMSLAPMEVLPRGASGKFEDIVTLVPSTAGEGGR